MLKYLSTNIDSTQIQNYTKSTLNKEEKKMHLIYTNFAMSIWTWFILHQYIQMHQNLQYRCKGAYIHISIS